MKIYGFFFRLCSYYYKTYKSIIMNQQTQKRDPFRELFISIKREKKLRGSFWRNSTIDLCSWHEIHFSCTSNQYGQTNTLKGSHNEFMTSCTFTVSSSETVRPQSNEEKIG